MIRCLREPRPARQTAARSAFRRKGPVLFAAGPSTSATSDSPKTPRKSVEWAAVSSSSPFSAFHTETKRTPLLLRRFETEGRTDSLWPIDGWVEARVVGGAVELSRDFSRSRRDAFSWKIDRPICREARSSGTLPLFYVISAPILARCVPPACSLLFPFFVYSLVCSSQTDQSIPIPLSLSLPSLEAALLSFSLRKIYETKKIVAA